MTAVDHVPISKRLVLINTIGTTLSHFLNVAFLLWLYQYLLGRIPTFEYSLLPLLSAVMVCAPVVAILLTSGIARFAVESIAKGEPNGVTQIVSTSFPFFLAVSPILLGGTALLAYFSDGLFQVHPQLSSDFRIMLIFVNCGIVLRIVCAPFTVGFAIRQRFVLMSLIELIAMLLRLAIMAALVIGISPRVLWVSVATEIANAVGQVLMVFVSRRMVPELRFDRTQIAWHRLRDIMKFNGWQSLTSVAFAMRNGSDAFVLNRLGTPMDMTSLHLGGIVYKQTRQLPLFALRSLNPALTAMHATDSRDRLASAYLRGGRHAVWFVGLVALPLMVYADEIMLKYAGPIHDQAPWVMRLMLITLVVTYCNILLVPITAATNRLSELAPKQFIVEVINVVVTMIFVGVFGWGAIGCAASTALCGSLAVAVWYIPYALGVTGIPVRRWFVDTIWFGYLPCVVGAATWIGLKWASSPSTWTSLLVCTLIGAVPYLVMVAFCSRAGDRRDFAEIAVRLTRLIPFRRATP